MAIPSSAASAVPTGLLGDVIKLLRAKANPAAGSSAVPTADSVLGEDKAATSALGGIRHLLKANQATLTKMVAIDTRMAVEQEAVSHTLGDIKTLLAQQLKLTRQQIDAANDRIDWDRLRGQRGRGVGAGAAGAAGAAGGGVVGGNLFSTLLEAVGLGAAGIAGATKYVRDKLQQRRERTATETEAGQRRTAAEDEARRAGATEEEVRRRGAAAEAEVRQRRAGSPPGSPPPPPGSPPAHQRWGRRIAGVLGAGIGLYGLFGGGEEAHAGEVSPVSPAPVPASPAPVPVAAVAEPGVASVAPSTARESIQTAEIATDVVGGLIHGSNAIAKKIPIIGNVLTAAEAGSIALDDKLSAEQKLAEEAKLGGSVAGALGGGAAGAALGTMIFPGIGTAIGGVLGSVAGGILGETAVEGLTSWIMGGKKPESPNLAATAPAPAAPVVAGQLLSPTVPTVPAAPLAKSAAESVLDFVMPTASASEGTSAEDQAKLQQYMAQHGTTLVPLDAIPKTERVRIAQEASAAAAPITEVPVVVAPAPVPTTTPIGNNSDRLATTAFVTAVNDFAEATRHMVDATPIREAAERTAQKQQKAEQEAREKQQKAEQDLLEDQQELLKDQQDVTEKEAATAAIAAARVAAFTPWPASAQYEEAKLSAASGIPPRSATTTPAPAPTVALAPTVAVGTVNAGGGVQPAFDSAGRPIVGFTRQENGSNGTFGKAEPMPIRPTAHTSNWLNSDQNSFVAAHKKEAKEAATRMGFFDPEAGSNMLLAQMGTETNWGRSTTKPVDFAGMEKVLTSGGHNNALEAARLGDMDKYAANVLGGSKGYDYGGLVNDFYTKINEAQGTKPVAATGATAAARRVLNTGMLAADSATGAAAQLVADTAYVAGDIMPVVDVPHAQERSGLMTTHSGVMATGQAYQPSVNAPVAGADWQLPKPTVTAAAPAAATNRASTTARRTAAPSVVMEAVSPTLISSLRQQRQLRSSVVQQMGNPALPKLTDEQLVTEFVAKRKMQDAADRNMLANSAEPPDMEAVRATQQKALNQALYGTDVAPVAPISAAPAAAATNRIPVGTSPMGGDRALLDRIAQGEGTSDATAKKHGIASGYDVSLAYGKYIPAGSKPLSEMTLGEVKQTQRQMLAAQSAAGIADDKRSSAVGKYQFISKTLAAQQAKLGLTDDTKFSPEVQDQLGKSLLQARGYDAWKAGKMSDAEFQTNLSKEWASVADPTKGGQSHYGQGVGTTTEQIQAAMAAAKTGAAAAPAPVAVAPVTPTTPVPTAPVAALPAAVPVTQVGGATPLAPMEPLVTSAQPVSAAGAVAPSAVARSNWVPFQDPAAVDPMPAEVAQSAQSGGTQLFAQADNSYAADIDHFPTIANDFGLMMLNTGFI